MATRIEEMREGIATTSDKGAWLQRILATHEAVIEEVRRAYAAG